MATSNQGRQELRRTTDEGAVKEKLVIGLTGNIGVGKSTVMRLLASLGAETIDADKVAHQVIEPGEAAYEQVVQAFGPGVLAADGSIDRGKLAAIVFNNLVALRRLEAIVHPAVFAEIRRRVAESTCPVVVIEAIKLLEGKLTRQLVDQIWLVTAPPDLQEERLRGRGVSSQETRRRLAAQSSQEEKAHQADVVLRNDGSLRALQTEVENAWRYWVEGRGEVTS